MLIGSPGFMSPEQVRGAELTPASDVFCLGAVLVYASTGRLLFGAAETGLNAHLFRVAEEEADLTGVPEALVALVRSCLHKVPAERPGLQQIADQTTTDRTEEWLPSPVLAQLGRHAAELLDFAPATEEAPAAGPPTHPPTTPVVSATPPAGPPTPADAAPAATGPATAAPATAAPTDAASPTPGGAVGFGPPLYPHPGGWVAPASAGALREAAPARSNRWWGLVAVVLAQLLVGLQAGAFTIELPAVQVDLHLAFGDRSLLVSIYTLTFVALVVIAGHAADLVGRKRTLVAGLAGFAAASLLGGTAADAAVLILARGLQGCSAALVTAAALALVIAEFTDPRERRIALGVYAAIAGGGSALGLFAGGNIAELLSWRMSLLAGVPLAAIALASTLVLPRDAARGGTARFDLIGALLGTVGLAAVTYGLVRAASNGWGDVGAVLLLVAGTPVFVAFLSWQSRTRPLPSSRVAMDRDRLAACFALVLTGTGAFALYTALSFYAQTDLGFSPTGTGTAFLPFAIALLAGSVLVSAGWASRVPIRARITVGLVLAALGLALLTDPSAGAGYTTQVLPGLALTGFGAGVALMPLIAAAVSGIAPDRAGAASATVAASLQLGAGLGSALFITRLLHLSGPVDSFRAAARADYTATLWWAAGGLVLAALAAGVLVTARPDDPR
jgi:MFS family permease